MSRYPSRTRTKATVWSLAAIAIAVAPAPASAQEAPAENETPFTPAAPADGATEAEQRAAADLAASYRSGHKMRTAGIVLTSIGLAISATAAGFFISAAVEERGVVGYVVGMERTLQGFFVLTPGVLFLAVGIPLWAVGAARRNRARRQGYTSASLLPLLMPTEGGVVAGLRIAAF